jgi:hypothetical protein
MDCKTARLLLDFARPHACELETEETAALDRHLDHCCDCHSLARDERLFDERIGKAMLQVEVPDGLRTQLLARLEAERGAQQRRHFAQGARWTAAAAAILVLCWGAWYWIRERTLAPVDTQRVVEAVTNDAAQEPRLVAENALRRMGVDTPLSPHLNYHWLAAPPMEGDLPGYPGRQVPVLVFERSGRHAVVYLIKEKAVPPNTVDIAGGATYKAELLPRAQGEHYRYLVVHDGDNLNWLMPPEPPAS